MARVQLMQRFLLLMVLVVLSACADNNNNNANGNDIVLVDLSDTVTIESGSLQGTIDDATQIARFQGVPYAAPPVGVNRWRAPHPVSSWEGARDATVPSAACLQADINSSLTQSEDCLYLNVAAPAGLPEAALPVMVWFHGGGDENGSGAEGIYNIAGLAQATGHVIVSVNSRLGFLGFLAQSDIREETTDGNAGNYHHQDQIAALQWVQDNIAQFNGDASNVTIFGESAGGNDVCRHLASRLSDGLFQKGILQSSTCSGNILKSIDTRLSQGQYFTQLWGCEGDVDVAACLRAQDAEGLRQLLVDAGKSGNLLDGSIGDQEQFRPAAAIDGVVFNSEPIEAIGQGPGDRSIIVGANQNEYTLFTQAPGSPNPDNNLLSYQQTLKSGVSGISDAQVQTLTTQTYPCSNYATCSDAMADLLADFIFVCPSIQTADALIAAGNTVRFYWFTAPVNNGLLLASTVPVQDINAPELGIPHSADLFYLWNLGVIQAGSNPAATTAAVQSYWGSFAATGEPEAEGQPDWPIYTSLVKEYLEIGEPIVFASGFKPGVCDVLGGIQ